MTELTETQQYLLRAGLQTDVNRIRRTEDFAYLSKLAADLRHVRMTVRKSSQKCAEALAESVETEAVVGRMIEEVDEALDRVLPPRGN